MITGDTQECKMLFGLQAMQVDVMFPVSFFFKPKLFHYSLICSISLRVQTRVQAAEFELLFPYRRTVHALHMYLSL